MPPHKELSDFRDLYKSLYGRVVGFVRKFGLSGEEAEDVAQNTFISVYRFRDSFKGTSAESTWVYSIARNAARGYKRTCSRQNRRLVFENQMELSLEEIAGACDDHFEVGVIEKRMSAEGWKKLASFIPSPYKQNLFVLKHVERLSNEQIAALYNIKPSTVKVVLHRAGKDLIENYRARAGVHGNSLN